MPSILLSAFTELPARRFSIARFRSTRKGHDKTIFMEINEINGQRARVLKDNEEEADMPVGVIVDALAVVIGGIVGAVAGKKN